MRLLERMIERQGQHSDGQMAARIGIARSTWVQIRNGRRHMGARTLHKVMAAFPSLRDEAVDYLATLPRRRARSGHSQHQDEG